MFKRRNAALIVGEFLGTAILTFVVLEVSRSSIGIPYFVAFGAGLAIVLSGLAIMGILGAGGVQFNPALTAALWTTRQVKTVKAIFYIIAQFLGGWAAYGLYKYLTQGPVMHGSTSFSSHILVAEAAGTFVFTFLAAGAVFQRLHGIVQSAIVGGAYAVGILVASVASNGFLNPAVALGTNSWSWGNFVLGPVLGAIIGVNLYALLFARPDKLGIVTARAGRGSSTTANVVTAKSGTSKTVKKVPAKKPAAKAKAPAKKRK